MLNKLKYAQQNMHQVDTSSSQMMKCKGFEVALGAISQSVVRINSET